MNHRPPGSTPMPQQFQDALFGLRVVSTAQPGMQDAFLLIDDDQRRFGLELHADFSPAGALNFPHFSITYCYWQAIQRKQDDLMPAVAVRT
ncbi:hypothetical protein ACQKPC_18050 [Pseudomonas sp. NPDC089918]|uniref:hypothetical protein n=1 Tax=Pseudomonas sp. NPDC089918 TaxID=3390654 RepID=UPI003D039135